MTDGSFVSFCVNVPEPAPEVFHPEGTPSAADDTAARLRDRARAFGDRASWVGGPARAVVAPGLWQGRASGDYADAVAAKQLNYEAATAACALAAGALAEYAQLLQGLRQRARNAVEDRERANRDRQQLIDDIAEIDARARAGGLAQDRLGHIVATLQSRGDTVAAEIEAVRTENARIQAETTAAEDELARNLLRAAELTEGRRTDGAARLGGDSESEGDMLAGLATAGGAALLAGGVFASGQEAAAWWKGLTAEQQRQAIALDPHRVGAVNGLPASARNQANRILLQEDLVDLRERKDTVGLIGREEEILANAKAIADQLRFWESRIDPTTGEYYALQLLVYEPGAFQGDGRAAIVVGDLDTADHVAVNVPGLTSTVDSYMESSISDSKNLYLEGFRASDGQTIASIGWVGYDAPSGFPESARVLRPGMAEDGARFLASDVAGIRDSRGSDQPHLTVVGHSYGSTTTAYAATEHHLAADDIALIGSPGAGHAERAVDLGVGRENVWVGSASQDGVTWLGKEGALDLPGLGRNPAEDRFDGQRFRAEAVDRKGYPLLPDHGKYYEPNSESLYNLAEIITGRDRVTFAEPRHDPWTPGDVDDPETRRMPTTRSH